MIGGGFLTAMIASVCFAETNGEINAFSVTDLAPFREKYKNVIDFWNTGQGGCGLMRYFVNFSFEVLVRCDILIGA